MYTPRERLLCGGPSGSSKTFSFLKIVEHLPEQHHLAIEVDDGFAKLLAYEFPDIKATIYVMGEDKQWHPHPDIQRGDTLRVYHCQSFRSVTMAQRALEQFIATKEMGAESWVSVDGLDLIYNKMRYELIEKSLPARIAKRTGKDTPIEDAWDAAMDARVAGAPMLEGGDWDMIHSFYENFLGFLAFQIPCNLYGATSLSTIDDRSPFESDDLKVFYKSLGVPMKFEGQKRTPRVFDTLLAFKHDASGYYAHVWKDRGRASQWNKAGPQMLYTNNDFFTDIILKYMKNGS